MLISSVLPNYFSQAASSTASSGTSSSRTPATGADAVLNKLMESDDMTQALTSQSSFYYLPSDTLVMTYLWAMFHTNPYTQSINESDVEAAVKAEGGTREDAQLLWSKMDSAGNGEVTAGDFLLGYIPGAVGRDVSTVQDNVRNQILSQGPSTDSNILSSFISAGGKGSVISGVGKGSGKILDVFL